MSANQKNISIPAVSVIIPFRNSEDTLAECLDSLRVQSLQHFEALLVDDGSEDCSADLVRARARHDTRLRLLSPGRIGLVHALNLGIKHARADLIARMDADDIMHPDRLEEQSKFMQEHQEIALVGCAVELFPLAAVRLGYREYVRWQNSCLEPDDIAVNMFVESPFAHPSVMIRRKVFDIVGDYRQGPFPEDYDLWLRMNLAGFRMSKLARVLLSWRERPDRTSRLDERYSRRSFDVLRARYLACDSRLQSGRGIVVWGGGRPTRLRVRLLQEQGVKIQAWVDVNPRRIGQTVWGLPVHPFTWLERRDRPFVLVYVTNYGARDEITGVLEEYGYRRGEDYLPVG